MYLEMSVITCEKQKDLVITFISLREKKVRGNQKNNGIS
jgi:hypothetical protein